MEDDGQPVNANGMFNGNRGNEEEEEGEADEYFDDAGDIGYLPADHVSCKFYNMTFLIFIAFDDSSSKCFDQAIDRRTRESRSLTQRERGRSSKGQEGKRRNWCVTLWSLTSTCQNANEIRKNPRQLQHCVQIQIGVCQSTRDPSEAI